MSQNRNSLCYAAIIVMLVGTVAFPRIAQTTLSGGNHFDLDQDGTINSEEFRQYLVNRIQLPLSALDNDGSGHVSSVELERFGILLDSVEASVEEYRALHPDGLQPVDFADFAGIDPPEPPPEPTWFERTGVLVRGKLEPIGQSSSARSLSAVGAATLSFSHDLRDKRAWSTLKGVLMRPVRFETQPELALTPSLAINQVRYRERARSEVDTLGLRLSFERLYPLDDQSSIESFGLRINPAYITDTDGETQILSAELELQATPSGSGVASEIMIGTLDIRWQPTLLAEYGRVLADPDVELADEEERFGRLGPSIDAEIRFGALQGLSFGFSWHYLVRVVGRQRDRERLEAAMNVALDRAGHFSVQALYVDGDASAKLEDEAYWSLGLGVRY